MSDMEDAMPSSVQEVLGKAKRVTPAWFSDAVSKYLRYDPETGNLVHSDIARYRAIPGNIADRSTTNGYKVVRLMVDGVRRSVCSHRVVWFLVKGYWPKEEIDHIDKVRDNNLIANLRECNREQNVVRRIWPERDLPRGVSWAWNSNKTNPYLAQMGGQYLGYHGTPEAAHKAYLVEFDRQHGDKWKEF